MSVRKRGYELVLLHRWEKDEFSVTVTVLRRWNSNERYALVNVESALITDKTRVPCAVVYGVCQANMPICNISMFVIIRSKLWQAYVDALVNGALTKITSHNSFACRRRAPACGPVDYTRPTHDTPCQYQITATVLLPVLSSHFFLVIPDCLTLVFDSLFLSLPRLVLTSFQLPRSCHGL